MSSDPEQTASDAALQALSVQARRLESACSIIQQVHGNLTLDSLVRGIVENLVEVGQFAGAKIAIETSIGDLRIEHEASAGRVQSDESLVRSTPVFIRGLEKGILETHYESHESLDEQTELLEFVLPTLYLSIDHAVAFAEVLDYRESLERKVEQRTAQLAEAHGQLSQSLEQLREAKAARDRFFANINHEIRTPLTLIQLAVDGVARSGEVNKPTTRQQLDDINASTRRLLHLVNSLLLLAAGDEGKLRVNPGPLDAAVVLQRLVRNWSTAAQRGEIDLVYEGPEACHSTLDETALETVVGNLISNAVKFTPKGGRITVSLSVTDDTISVRVRDTGPGIDPEFAPKLFGRFERSAEAINKQVRGSGIGLSLTKELVELQSGSIDVVRHDDPRGTSFVVVLPRHQIVSAVIPQAERGVVARVEPPSIPLPVVTRADEVEHDRRAEALILIAEDDPTLARHVSEILSSRYDVIVAPNGAEALELAGKHRPDLLVTDLDMPIMDGIELTRRFLQLDGTSLTPVLIVSAHAGLSERLAGFEAGAVDYVLKPFSADELHARIRSQLAIRKLALRLHESEKLAALGMMSSGLAHELRNPANAVVNALEPLWNQFPEEQRGEDSIAAVLYDVTRTAALQIRDLCGNILDFATAKSVAGEPIDLRALLVNARRMLLTKLAPVTVVEEITIDRPVDCAGPLILQILVNLIDNAAYAAGTGGTVWITARFEGELAVIEVSDSGAGVPAHLQERIFDPFFTTKPPGQGTGLGLAVSRRIALNHGGDLHVVRRGDRSVFRLELPQMRAQA